MMEVVTIILTNAGSLGSDKTLGVPNSTGTLATTAATNLGGLGFLSGTLFGLLVLLLK